MIIYISGPMSGYPEHNFPAFHDAAARLRAQGYDVINPAEIEQPDLSWEACMRKDIAELMRADAIALLPGWQRSRGARMEVTIASLLGMRAGEADTLEPVVLDVTVDIRERGAAPANPGDTYSTTVTIVKVKKGTPTVIRVSGREYILRHEDTHPAGGKRR